MPKLGLKNTLAAKIPLCGRAAFKVSKMWQYLVLCHFPLMSVSSFPSFLPSPIFEPYNILRSDRLSSVAEERLSSVRLTHLPLNNLITLQNNACVSLTKLVLCCSKYPEGKWLGHG